MQELNGPDVVAVKQILLLTYIKQMGYNITSQLFWNALYD
jgi:hypothetical protein